MKLEARLIAIEHALANLYGIVYAAIGATPEMIETSLTRFQSRLATETLGGMHPAQSDLLIAELEEAFDRLIGLMKGIALAKAELVKK